MKELALAETLTAVQLYSEGQMTSVIGRIEKEALSIVPNIETAAGRKEIASLAHKIAKSKTHLDNLGKDLKSEAQKTVKAVDAERKIMRDKLDELKLKVRQPLTEFEENEKKVAEDLIRRIYDIVLFGNDRGEDEILYSSGELKDRLKLVKAISIDEAFGEKASEAAIEKDLSISRIEKNILLREVEEKEKEELNRLRIENEERVKREREEKIREQAKAEAELEAKAKIKQAEEKAMTERIEAENKAKEEKAQAEREKAESEAKWQAEIKAAEEKAEREKQAMLEAQKEKEREELSRIAKAKAEDDKRKQDTEHRAKINRNILAYLVGTGLSEEKAKEMVISMASSQVPHVSINY